MATKNNPGKFDRYGNADPDEPMFILLGRDRHAAVLVRLWAILRAHDGEDQAKIEEAIACAKAMDGWADTLGKIRVWGGRPGHGLDPEAYARHPSYALTESLFMAATKGLDEHPDGFNDPCQCATCLSYD
jgi:hypothetical protein